MNRINAGFSSPEIKTAKKEQLCCYCNKFIAPKTEYMSHAGIWHKGRGLIPDRYHLDCWSDFVGVNDEEDEFI